ncbi:uncharacterized protein LOC123004380 [Tribolium madens]|uniref:uncharacterized protein LOC123004380 n=1 Tax=Tribolium madens TaxID=41895 RepID=UPI001CF71EB6|nr:uncharacterized protein LOC123004380 [Tribolium madens]
MNILHALFFLGVLLPALSDPDLPHTLARISEARARAIANRARLRANSARVINQVRNNQNRATLPSRSKRQHMSEEYPQDLPPPPLDQHFDYEEPTFVHICPMEDGLTRSAEKSGEDFHLVGEPELRSNEENHLQPGSSLNKALDELMEARRLLDRFEAQNGRNSEQREADAHRSHFHSHQHSTIHGRGHLPLPVTQILNPGLPISQTHVVTPGLNLNIHQNQGLNSGLHSHGHFLNQGVVPTHISPIHGGVITHQGVVPSQITPMGVFQTSSNQNFQRVGSTAEDARESAIDAFDQNDDISFLDRENFREVSPTMQEFQSRTQDFNEEFQDISPDIEDSELKQLENDLSVFEDGLSEERKANPTLHKKMKLKQKLNQKFNKGYPSYGPPPQYYSHYKEAENSEEIPREASPTLHKKLKQKLNQKFSQGYPSPPPQYYSHYREADDELAREANPTLHKKLKLKQKLNQKFNQGYPTYGSQPQFYGHYREAEPQQSDEFLQNFEDMREASQREDENNPFSDTITSPYLFDVPNRRLTDYKRSVDKDLDALLGVQRQIIDTMKEKSQNDEDLEFLTDISNRTLSSIEDQRRKISKRSIPLTRLISDPNVRLDVPKTFENFGTATKHAFEDERAPMYHLKHLMGSSKNALLSAMRIPPQNMIIPSDYEIVKASERATHRSRVRDQDDPFSNTFKRVGEMVRDSIRSGQDTVAHISDAAHEARNILNTARHAAPRLIIPYSQIPAVQKTGSRKAILITPRILDLAEEHSARKSSDLRPNFIRLGHLMDAVGFSKPHSKNLDLQKIIFEPRRVNKNNDDIVEALNTLEDAKISVGAKNLRDLLLKMKNELTNVVTDEPKKKKHKSKKKKQQETKEMGKFIENLFDGTQEETKDEKVGDMMLSPELLRPFMGQPSENDLHNYLRENGDEDVDQKSPKNHFEKLQNFNHSNSDLGYVLGAINPLMFERMFNQTVKVNNSEQNTEEDGTVGTAMTLNGPMLKPFMGQAQEHAVEDFLDTYNADPNDDYVDVVDE